MAWDDALDMVDAAITATTGILQWGESITYKSFGDGTVTLNATRDRTNSQYEDQGVWVRSNEVMFFIRTGDLISDGTALEPKRKDIITDGTNTYDYLSHELDSDGTMYQITVEKADI